MAKLAKVKEEKVEGAVVAQNKGHWLAQKKAEKRLRNPGKVLNPNKYSVTTDASISACMMAYHSPRSRNTAIFQRRVLDSKTFQVVSMACNIARSNGYLVLSRSDIQTAIERSDASASSILAAFNSELYKPKVTCKTVHERVQALLPATN